MEITSVPAVTYGTYSGEVIRDYYFGASGSFRHLLGRSHSGLAGSVNCLRLGALSYHWHLSFWHLSFMEQRQRIYPELVAMLVADIAGAIARGI